MKSALSCIELQRSQLVTRQQPDTNWLVDLEAGPATFEAERCSSGTAAPDQMAFELRR